MLCVMLETILKAFVGGNNIFKEWTVTMDLYEWKSKIVSMTYRNFHVMPIFTPKLPLGSNIHSVQNALISSQILILGCENCRINMVHRPSVAFIEWNCGNHINGSSANDGVQSAEAKIQLMWKSSLTTVIFGRHGLSNFNLDPLFAYSELLWKTKTTSVSVY